MGLWNKIVFSGSNASLNQVTASFFKGDGSSITGIISSSYALSASYAPSSPSISASYAATASYAGIYRGSGVIPPNTVASVPSGSIFKFRYSTLNDALILSDFDGTSTLGAGDALSYVTAVNGGTLSIVGLTTVDILNNNFELNLGSNAVFTDFGGNGGLKYAAEYSASYTSRSFADVGYVNSKVRLVQSASFALGGSGSFVGDGTGLTGIVSSSYSATSSFNTSTFSRASTYFVSGGMSVVPEAFTIWRTPYPCRVVSLQGWTDVSGSSINARKSGSGGWAAHTSSFILNKHSDWVSANSVTNTDYSTNDTLQIMITGSTASSRVTVQINFIRI